MASAYHSSTSSGTCVGDHLYLVAETGPAIGDFGPFVASINDQRAVAFWARDNQGQGALFVAASGQRPRRVPNDGPDSLEFAPYSHPDIDSSGELSVYAHVRGEQCVIRCKSGQVVSVAGPRLGVDAVGPLGPSVSPQGVLAFRGVRAGVDSVFVLDSGMRVAACADEYLAGFVGLPHLGPSGQGVVRARRHRGGDVLLSFGPKGEVRELCVDGPSPTWLGFPFQCESQRVLCCGRDAAGREHVYQLVDGHLRSLYSSSSQLVGFRGVLGTGASGFVFYAAFDGALGIFIGGPEAVPVVRVGDELAGRRVSEFALNPVSINTAGDFVIRVGFDDGSGAIVLRRSGR